MDVLEIDAASNTGVDNVREVIINSISIAPARDRHKIFIIDEVHMLSTQAFNALLKTLEEPPPRVVFIMATTELQKVPETILSRCQVFEFRTITLKKIVGQLRHIAENLGVKISDSALMAVARAGEGSMRDAESALDQVISFAGLEVTDEDVSAALGLVDIETLNNTISAIAEQNAERVFRIVDEIVARGYDLRNFCREMIVHLRSLLVVKVAGFDAELVQMPQSEGEQLTRLAEQFSEQDLIRFFSILTKTEQDIRSSSQPRFQLEIGLMKLVQARRLYSLEDALSRLIELQSLAGGAGISSSGSNASPVQSPRPAGKTATPISSAAPRPTERQNAVEPPRSFKPSPSRVEESFAPVASSPEPAPRATSGVFTANEPPLPSEPPSLPDDPYPYEPELPQRSARPTTMTGEEGDVAIKKIIAVLEAKRKIMSALALEKAQVKIDGDYLRVTLSTDNAKDKMQLDGRDKRQAVEEAAREVLGRRLTLSVSVGGQPQVESSSRPREAAPGKTKKDEVDPRINSILDKFQGKIIDP
jgi:DNA polymerase-3 subunit gamma/tau